MGRGVSSGGGQSSLGYLFGGGETPKSVSDNAAPVQKPAPPPLLTKRFQLVSKAVKQKTSTEQMGRIVEISSQIDLPRRCMLLLEVVLPLVTCLVMGVTDAILGCLKQ